ncbi:hypothetical protein FB451DRAFT_1263948 [Mycena latifolia]|nr:hypothetical protein FB451DRAFT_1263948 [Mycena latifolia]
MERLWPRLMDTRHTSPHLIRYIHRLHIIASLPNIEIFSTICNFPFTHLRHVSIHMPLYESPLASSIQQLLSMPSLVRVAIACAFFDAPVFQQIWDSCSPSIKHLDLVYYWKGDHSSSHRCIYAVPTLRLESLQVVHPGSELRHDVCPFDLTGLKLLSIGQNVYTEAVRWQSVVPAFKIIIALNLTVTDTEIIDLSLFPKIVLLRMSIEIHLQKALDTLSTITASNRIRRIVINNIAFLDNFGYEQFDSKLSNLPLHQPFVVELEMDRGKYTRASPCFFRMNSRMLRRVDSDPQWFNVSSSTRTPVFMFHNYLFQNFPVGSLSN